MGSFCVWSFKDSLRILDINLISDMWYKIISSHSVGCCFYSVDSIHWHFLTFDHACMDLFMGFLFCSFGLYVLMPVLYCLDYCSFVENLMLASMTSSFFLFNIVLAASWYYLWIFGMCFLFLQKNHWGFDRGCVDFVDHFGYYWYVNKTKSFNLWMWDFFYCVCFLCSISLF